MSFNPRTRIFTVHENPDRRDPADRVELVREGFAIWALLFHVFWMLYNKLWIPAAGYVGLLAVLLFLGEHFHLEQVTVMVLQLFLQVMLGFTGYDLVRWNLGIRGFRMAGVIAAETPLHAARRYYDVLA